MHGCDVTFASCLPLLFFSRATVTRRVAPSLGSANVILFFFLLVPSGLVTKSLTLTSHKATGTTGLARVINGPLGRCVYRVITW